MNPMSGGRVVRKYESEVNDVMSMAGDNKSAPPPPDFRHRLSQSLSK